MLPGDYSGEALCSRRCYQENTAARNRVAADTKGEQVKAVPSLSLLGYTSVKIE
jgi:hypothetical protein